MGSHKFKTFVFNHFERMTQQPEDPRLDYCVLFVDYIIQHYYQSLKFDVIIIFNRS
jgi:hypothetical protein